MAGAWRPTEDLGALMSSEESFEQQMPGGPRRRKRRSPRFWWRNESTSTPTKIQVTYLTSFLLPANEVTYKHTHRHTVPKKIQKSTYPFNRPHPFLWHRKKNTTPEPQKKEPSAWKHQRSSRVGGVGEELVVPSGKGATWVSLESEVCEDKRRPLRFGLAYCPDFCRGQLGYNYIWFS